MARGLYLHKDLGWIYLSDTDKANRGFVGEDMGEGLGVKGPSGWQVKDELGLDMWELCTIDTHLKT